MYLFCWIVNVNKCGFLKDTTNQDRQPDKNNNKSTISNDVQVFFHSSYAI